MFCTRPKMSFRFSVCRGHATYQFMLGLKSLVNSYLLSSPLFLNLKVKKKNPFDRRYDYKVSFIC